MQKRFENNSRNCVFEQKYTYSITSESLIKPVKIIKSHGNGQPGGLFGRCVRCGFVVSVVLHEFEYSPSPLKIDATCQKKTAKIGKTLF